MAKFRQLDLILFFKCDLDCYNDNRFLCSIDVVPFTYLQSLCAWFLASVTMSVFLPCPSSVSSGRTGCRSLWPAALPVSD